MATLFEIREYVQKTAEIISSVIGMDVIICDAQRTLLGDSNPYRNTCDEYISENSILNTTMVTRNLIFLAQKEEYNGCKNCENKESCNVQSIVAMPIMNDEKVFGAIGILALAAEAKASLTNKMDYYKKFVGQMADLLVGKIKEKEANMLLTIMKERLVSIIESIDSGIIAVDEKGKVIFYNSNALNFIEEKLLMSDSLVMEKIIDKPYLKKLVSESEDFKNLEILFSPNSTSIHALISGKPIIFDKQSIGAIITIKKISDVYDEVNQFSTVTLQAGLDDIIGKSDEIINLKKKIRMVAKSSSTVLIQGESGTGKELVARAIHGCSNISEGPFIALNCAAIPDNLLESELFGYDEGAFSGAKKGGKLGKIQLADGGTIFLDEIGEMLLHLQTKLLRVLQERCIEKLGGIGIIPINIRIVAATNRNLEAMVAAGEFREDLYYRLNVIPLYIPPLRERKVDVKPLLDYFLKDYSKKLNKPIQGFSEDAMRVLINHPWKGNVRELQNVVEYAVNMSDSNIIRKQDLHIRLFDEQKEEVPIKVTTIENIMNNNIREALNQFGRNLEGKEMAAKALGISRATLYRKIKEFQIE